MLVGVTLGLWAVLYAALGWAIDQASPQACSTTSDRLVIVVPALAASVVAITVGYWQSHPRRYVDENGDEHRPAKRARRRPAR